MAKLIYECTNCGCTKTFTKKPAKNPTYCGGKPMKLKR